MEKETGEEGFFVESRQKVQEYLEDRIKLFKLQTVEKISSLIGMAVSGFIIAVLCFFLFFFSSIMLGFYLSELTGSYYMGFGILIAIFFIAFLMVISFKGKIIEPFIVNKVIDIFFEKPHTSIEDEQSNETK